MDQGTDAMATRSSPAARVAEDRSTYDGNKPLDDIEEDIARTRVRLSATIEELERELAPRRIVEKGAEMFRSSLEPGPGPFREQAWAYAIPLALILSGLGWLFALRRRSWQADVPSSVGETSAEAVETAETTLACRYAGVGEPAEPVSLVDDKTEI
jgi:Protein of unknown function (DUF3618)